MNSADQDRNALGLWSPQRAYVAIGVDQFMLAVLGSADPLNHKQSGGEFAFVASSALNYLRMRFNKII